MTPQPEAKTVAGEAPAPLITGTPWSAWTDVAALVGHDDATAAGAPRVEPDPGRALQSLASSAQPALVLVDDPAAAIAVWLSGGGEGTTAALDAMLASWCAQCRALMHAAQRWPERVCMVESSAVRRDPAAFERLLMGRALTLRKADEAPSGQADPAATLLAAALWAEARTDPEVAQLLEEVQAACVPLAEAPATSQAPLWAAWQRHRSAAADARHQALLVEQVLQLETELRGRAGMASGPAGGKAAKHERDLLLAQVQQLEQELKRRAGVAPLATQPAAPPAGLKLLAASESPPHRHLHLRVQNVPLAKNSVKRMEVRLVEHHGRPGLALIATPDRPRPLEAWRPEGSEGTHEYMLLVPSDEASVQKLALLGSSDWQLVRSIAQALVVGIPALKPAVAPDWTIVAARLERQLDALPARLRFDGIRHRAAPAEMQDALELEVLNPLWGERPLRKLVLRWSPGAGATAPLQCLAPPEAADVPFVGWPAGERGVPAPAFALPADDMALSALWAGLDAGDRALWLSLCDALPGAAAAVPDKLLPAALTRDALAAQAERLRRHVHQVAAARSRRERLLALARRLRARLRAH